LFHILSLHPAVSSFLIVGLAGFQPIACNLQTLFSSEVNPIRALC